MIDVKHQVSAVRRTMGTRTLEAGEARVLTISQAYATTIDDLWDAVTSAERIPRWPAHRSAANQPYESVYRPGFRCRRGLRDY